MLFFQRRSISPGSSSGGGQNLRTERSRSPEAKKLKKEEDEGDRSDQDLVVDDTNEGANANANSANGAQTAPHNPTANGNRSPKENGNNSDSGKSKDPLSPSSQRSTPASLGKKEEKRGTSPGIKLSPPVSKALAGLGT